MKKQEKDKSFQKIRGNFLKILILIVLGESGF